jgi:hypothetical protein
MRKIIMIVVAVIVTVAGVGTGIGIGNWVHDSNNNNQAGFIGNIPGITNQDIRLCRSSWKNGGKYFHHFYNVKLTCTRQHISVDFDHQSED